MGVWVVLIKAMLTVGGSAVLCILLGNYLCYPFLWKESLQVWICRHWGQWSDPFSCSCRRGSCFATICVGAPWRCSGNGVSYRCMGSGASKRLHWGDKREPERNMSGKGSDQHLRELLLEKTGEIQRLKAEIERWELYTLIFGVAGMVRGVAYTVFSV